MIKIDALPAFNDNYIWLLQDPAKRLCAVVDPGDAAPVLTWLSENPGWQLSDILITHHHFDHVGGVESLKTATGARVSGPANEKIPARDVGLDDGDQVEVLGLTFSVMAVPGHTLGHIAYVQPEHHWLFCGDTLFAAGCGRLFEGTPAQMHASLSRFAQLDDRTEVYCTHEYTLSNLRFAVAVEPGNACLQARYADVTQWREEGRISLPSTIALEKSTNPFMRCEVAEVMASAVRQSDTALNDSVAVFAALRSWKDTF